MRKLNFILEFSKTKSGNRSPQRFHEDLLDELGLGQLQVDVDVLLPVLPAPAELEVGQMVREPSHKPRRKKIRI